MTTSTDINADSIEAFIAGLTASYIQPTCAAPQQTPVRKPRATKTAAPVVVAPTLPSPSHTNPAPAPVVAALPTAGTLSAKEYFVSMRRAKSRDEQIAAIAGFIGYDRCKMYAEQELAANLQGKKVLNPPKASPAISGAAISLQGYTKGMPDMKAKRLADLQGREVAAVENMLSHRKAAAEQLSQGNQVQAIHFANLAKLESDRLEQIRRDLNSL
jgi:hypothetical protein